MNEKSPDAPHGEREGRRLQGLIGLLAVVALAGCAGPTPAEESPVASASPVQRTLLAIGDSIPFNAAGDCPGCTGFVESYADDLSASTGETYVAVNRSRHDGAQLDAADPEIAAAVNSTIAAGLMAWRTEVCDVARSVNAQCIDLLEAFNGPEGATAAGALLAADYTHPSQAGNDLIRELLAAD